MGSCRCSRIAATRSPRYLLAEISSARIISVSTATIASGRMRQRMSTSRGTSAGGGLPLSRALAYSNGKAAANSFTQWLAVHMAQEHSSKIRVNAIAPGFMITEQNRFLLLQKNSQELTSRGETILKNVPMGRFGDPQEVTGAVLWLLSDEATFVTGAVIPIDGGFSAFDGV